MMAIDSSFLSFHQSLLDWDQLPIGVSDFHDIISAENMESSSSSDASIQYNLQDALANSTEICKRRRKEFSGMNEPNIADYEDLNYLSQDFWDSNLSDPANILNSVAQESTVVSDDPLASALIQSPSFTQQTALSHSAELNSTESHRLSDSSNASSPSFTHNLLILPPKGNKKKRSISVVHPFVAVKPAGLEGDMTLEEINQKILMRPARPVPHPVGEFAFGPAVSFGGPGLSGKSVVSLMRIQTRGTGSITIIRTKG